MAQDPRQFGSTEPLRVVGKQSENATNDFDKARLNSYRVYEDLYLSNSSDYKVILRGGSEEDQRPVYVPNGEKIVEAKIRFLGQGLEKKFSKANQAFEDALAKYEDREGWEQKFANLKRWGEIRGDAILMVIGDEDKDPGSRLSLIEIDPSTYFPVESRKNPNTVLGVYLVDEYPHPDDPKNKVCARVQKYMREYDEETEKVIPGTPITYSEELFETGCWDDRPYSLLKDTEIKLISTLDPPRELDSRITTLPTFHFRGHPLMNTLFGRSGLAGLETLIFSVNQTMTDEDLTVVFGGLGFYATDAGSPRNSAGQPIPWTISPLSMLEHGKEEKIYRVNGVASLEPSQTHMQHAEEEMQQTKGVPDVAVGVVDATVAESGIALELKLGAILSASQEQELELKAQLRKYYYNLATQWFPVYEGVGIESSGEDDLQVDITFKDPKPVNQEKRFNQLMMMWDAGIISAKLLTEELSKIMGFEMSEEDFKKAQEDKKSMAIAADPFSAQMMAEQNAGGNPNDPNAAGANQPGQVNNGAAVGVGG